MRSKVKKMAESTFIKTVTSIVKRYGRARVVVRDRDHQEACECMCKHCKADFESNYGESEMRRRLISKDGNCIVSYKGSDYRRWSGYQECCFMEVFDQAWCDECSSHYCGCKQYKKTPRKALVAMLEHDVEEFEPIAIEYGKRFKRSLKVKLKKW